MKRLYLLFSLLFFMSINSWGAPSIVKTNSNPDKKNNLNSLNSKDKTLQKELEEFEEIQRESEYLKILIKNKNLMKELGIKDRDDIFDKENRDREIKDIYLVSTFKEGIGPEKATILIAGKGMKILKKGDLITRKIEVTSIKKGDVKVTFLPSGNSYDLNCLNY
ncbi:hypothetical protein SAMN05216516_102291 [Izhakiella capsodis]|uniref:Type IV pilus biogenesis protein PilP n=2 Tax=cellular organisms TaxID=131567 RepID=A0A1I4W672_9GAMM|nr:hypothetical protein [Izhakiella capsodis]SFN08559.1 hypothetical protein SAMN05216516_102291 [Izhakiella capsodis]